MPWLTPEEKREEYIAELENRLRFAQKTAGELEKKWDKAREAVKELFDLYEDSLDYD